MLSNKKVGNYSVGMEYYVKEGAYDSRIEE